MSKPTRLLLKSATKSDYKSRHSAMILKHGRPLAVAHNFRGRHAEERVIQKVGEAAHGATLLSFRLKKDGLPGLAKPCHACSAFIRSAGLKRVWFTDEKGEWREDD